MTILSSRASSREAAPDSSAALARAPTLWTRSTSTTPPTPTSSPPKNFFPGSPVAGRAYFLSNGEPLPLWTLVNRILAADGQPPVTRSIPTGVAYAAGVVLEFVHRALNLEAEPRMTRFLAHELSTAHWFDLSAARRDLGYEPKVSIDEGLRRLAAWLRTQHPDQSRGPEQPRRNPDKHG